jgi:hypothetical protein
MLRDRYPWPPRSAPHARALATLLSAAWIAAGCGGVSPRTSLEAATDAEWRALRRARPEPLPGAARVTVSDMHFLGAYPWPSGAPVSAKLGVAELAVAGLLRRRDVDFVERRRFAVAAEAERDGERRRDGQPPAGVSRSVDLSMNAVWIATGAEGATVEIRLVRLETGSVAGTTRRELSADADPVTLARAVVGGVLDVLDALDRLPTWDDPARRAGDDDRGDVAPDALLAFLRGLAAEEAFRWEEARRAYQEAARDPDFHEAAAALARTARLRLGGTLAESAP